MDDKECERTRNLLLIGVPLADNEISWHHIVAMLALITITGVAVWVLG